MTSLALLGACALLALGGLGGANIIFRVTEGIREAELAASTVATRALAGDTSPCAPSIDHVIECSVLDGVATVRVDNGGVVASAIAGPEH